MATAIGESHHCAVWCPKYNDWFVQKRAGEGSLVALVEPRGWLPTIAEKYHDSAIVLQPSRG